MADLVLTNVEQIADQGRVIAPAIPLSGQ